MKLSKEWLKDGTLELIGGLFLAVFTFFSAISSISYMKEWKTDQSLLDAQSFFGDSVSIANKAGGTGFRMGHFLVENCFGVASVLFCLALGYLSYKLIRGRKVNWVSTAICAVGFPFVISLILAYVCNLIGGEVSMYFGGGLGGGASAFLAKAMVVLFGDIVTVVILLVLSLVLFLLWDNSLVGVIRKPVGEESSDSEPARAEVVAEPAAPSDDEDFQEETASFDDAPLFDDDASFDDAAPFDNSCTDDDSSAGEDEQAPRNDVNVTIQGPEEELSTDIQEELPQLDIRSDVDRYTFPSLDLLEDYADKRYTIPRSEIERNTEKIKATLASFKIPIESIEASVGYTVTLYRIILGQGVRVNQVKNIEEDIAIKIGIKGVRVVMLSDAVGIEVPNDRPSVVPLKAILNSDAFRNSKAELPIAVGYTITTKAKVFDLADAPHLLVAGATKQGKSVGLNAIISSLLYCKHPSELKFVFIDPKMVEFQKYSKLIDHYLAVLPSSEGDDAEARNAIVTDPKNADAVLNSLCVEMDERYKLMSAAGENKITDYNEKFRNRRLLPTEGHHFMPYLVVIIDEYADLTKSLFGSDKNLSRSIENSINRLAAKGRAAGLHVIIATQRPSVDVITGTIKGNFPTRMAFRTVQRQDSQTILGMPGAERLIGKGDMLFFAGADAERVQCALVDTDEIERVTSFISSQQGYHQRCTTPYYLPEPLNPDGTSMSGEPVLVDMKNIDPMFEEAARMAVMNQQISTSLIQRKMQLGFARAGRVMDQLESAGIVGPQNGAKSREVLVPDLASLQPILDAFIK